MNLFALLDLEEKLDLLWHFQEVPVEEFYLALGVQLSWYIMDMWEI